jgi:hypothetical protein
MVWNHYRLPPGYIELRREIRLTSQRTRKTKNKIFAIPAAAPAIPKRPKAPAIKAIIKNTNVQCNILLPPARLQGK